MQSRHSHHIEQKLLSIVGKEYAPTLSFKKTQYIRLAAENALTFLLQYLGLMLSVFIPFDSPAWLASGTACALIFLRGYTILPGLWLGTLVTFLSQESSFFTANAAAAIFTLQTIIIYALHRYLLIPTLVFYHFRLLIASLILFGLTTGAASLALLKSYSLSLSLWKSWWLANFNGAVLFSYLLIALDAYFPQIDTFKQRRYVYLSFVIGLILLNIILITNSTTLAYFPFIILTCLICYLSFALNWCSIISILSLIAFLFDIAAYMNAPYFGNSNLAVTLMMWLSASIVMALIINMFNQKKIFKLAQGNPQ